MMSETARRLDDKLDEFAEMCRDLVKIVRDLAAEPLRTIEAYERRIAELEARLDERRIGMPAPVIEPKVEPPAIVPVLPRPRKRERHKLTEEIRCHQCRQPFTWIHEAFSRQRRFCNDCLAGARMKGPGDFAARSARNIAIQDRKLLARVDAVNARASSA